MVAFDEEQIYEVHAQFINEVKRKQKAVVLASTSILSTSPWENSSAWSDKLVWVKKYLGRDAYKRLILSHHKELNIGDYLIDYRLKNGADKFQGELIHFGSDKFPDWDSVVMYLSERGS